MNAVRTDPGWHTVMRDGVAVGRIARVGSRTVWQAEGSGRVLDVDRHGALKYPGGAVAGGSKS